MPHRNNVLPSILARTEADCRRALARDLNRLCVDNGPQSIGLAVGCDEKTVRNARDETSSLKLHTALNLLVIDPGALDTLLAEFGMRLVPIDAEDVTRNATRITTRAAASVAEMTDPDSAGGPAIFPEEVMKHEDEIRASHRLTGWLLGMLDKRRGHGLKVVNQ